MTSSKLSVGTSREGRALKAFGIEPPRECWVTQGNGKFLNLRHEVVVVSMNDKNKTCSIKLSENPPTIKLVAVVCVQSSLSGDYPVSIDIAGTTSKEPLKGSINYSGEKHNDVVPFGMVSETISRWFELEENKMRFAGDITEGLTEEKCGKGTSVLKHDNKNVWYVTDEIDEATGLPVCPMGMVITKMQQQLREDARMKKMKVTMGEVERWCYKLEEEEATFILNAMKESIRDPRPEINTSLFTVTGSQQGNKGNETQWSLYARVHLFYSI